MVRLHLVVIDPAVKTPETDAFNAIATRFIGEISYHLPALSGLTSLRHVAPPCGIIVFGSYSSVHDGLEWQKELGKWLMEQWRLAVPTLGLCFGHQLVAHLFGAKIEYLNPDQSLRQGFQKIQLSQNRLLGAACEGYLYVSHREIVSTCPKSFLPIGQSVGAALEALEHQTLPLWTFQAHPEATEAFIQRRAPTESLGDRLSFGRRIVDSFLAYCLKRP